MYRVTRNGMDFYTAETMEDAIEWATGAAPAKPPKGFQWKVMQGSKCVAVVKYNPLPLVVKA